MSGRREEAVGGRRRRDLGVGVVSEGVMGGEVTEGEGWV